MPARGFGVNFREVIVNTSVAGSDRRMVVSVHGRAALRGALGEFLESGHRGGHSHNRIRSKMLVGTPRFELGTPCTPCSL